MLIKFSFTRREFEQASFQARPLLLRNAEKTLSLELIGPVAISQARGRWTLTSPALLRLPTAEKVFRVPLEEVAVALRSGSIVESGRDLALVVDLKHLHLARSTSVTEQTNQLLTQRLWDAQGWQLLVLPIAEKLQGGQDNLLSSPSFPGGSISLRRDAGEFAISLETQPNGQSSHDWTPSVDQSTPETARLLTSQSANHLTAPQLRVPSCMRIPKSHGPQLPMPLEARG